MQLSTKARYATRAMLELAMKYGKGTVQLKEVAQKQEISVKYLEQVMLPLRTGGYVYTRKGSGGGYMLAVDPHEITVYDIVQTVEGSLAPLNCVDAPEICEKADTCVARDVWCRLKEVIAEELGSLTLADLAARQEKKQTGFESSFEYHI